MTGGFCLYCQIVCSSRCIDFASCFVVIYNFWKEKAIFVQPSVIMLFCLVPRILPQKLIGAKLSKLGYEKCNLA